MKCFLSVCVLLVCLSQSAKAELEPFGGGCTSSSVEVSVPRYDIPKDALYLVVDLSGGTKATSYPVSSLSDVPEGGWTVEHKTTKLVMRRIEAGTFMMGSPDDELGRIVSREGLHQVTLTKPYYIGVFEVTQKQWSLVMGNDPSAHKGDVRPMENISYSDIRGKRLGAKWPESAEVDATSFMGKLRSKTGIVFDLPTEAQWEYACRAGTSTALNSGKSLTATGKCSEMTKVGRSNRFTDNQSDGGKGGYSSAHTTVGSYLPNEWGLYDMHGNVWDWSLDWSLNWRTPSHGTASVTDPEGAASGSRRLIRGGGWNDPARDCRSAGRNFITPSVPYFTIGLRLASSIGWQETSDELQVLSDEL